VYAALSGEKWVKFDRLRKIWEKQRKNEAIVKVTVIITIIHPSLYDDG